ncbi:MAG: 50S ribosomal protein L5 [Deltaproteobacteria bacterium]|nr:50S ribosomal protein L5 [Deltaproteobacteria bacterium]MBV8452514.1 50S ribosomal protein L5 [Deltaproteobacteria bacterium]
MADEEKSVKPQARGKKSQAGQNQAPAGADKGGRKKRGGEVAAVAEAAPAAEPQPKIPARLKIRYDQEIVPVLMRDLKIDNRMRVPKLDKIVINMALGEARENVKILDAAVDELQQITGQKPVITRARKAISNFKLRQGMPIGVMLTLRREHMYEFFDRMVNIALPRVRDFRGVSDKAFDGRGNYSLGIREHTIFPELNLDKIERVKGMTISVTTTAKSDFESYTLLKALGLPFRGSGGEIAARAA